LAQSVPQSILDALTDVDMPKVPSEPAHAKVTRAAGFSVPVVAADAIVLGSGAAGLKAAVELKRCGVDAVIVTQAVYGGTSACSGSDKQTLHTANGADQGDNFNALAAALAAGGAMDEDVAYVEAVGSARALASLQFLGLPVPVDSLGAVLRYQTDHDEVGRATSCGPRTSRLMVQALAREAIRLGVPIFNRAVGAKLLTEKRAGGERAIGLLAIQAGARAEDNPFGFVVFLSLLGYVGAYHFGDPAQLGWFALIGILGGLIGLLYAKGFYGIADRAARLPLPRWARPHRLPHRLLRPARARRYPREPPRPSRPEPTARRSRSAA